MNNIENLKPFKKFCIYLGSLPSAYINSMTYYEALTYVIKYLEREVIPTVNNNSDVVKELQEFVTHYFDNLDVQEEINNKLDEMAESGELPEIIGQYLELAGVHPYNNVSEMKEAENLINGSICETLGYYEANDGGSAKYKIRLIEENEEPDEMLVIALDNENLVAELILDNVLVPQMLGARSNSNYDDTDVLSKVFEVASNNGIEIQLKGKYYVKSPLIINTGNSIVCNGSHATIGTLLSEQTNNFSNIIFNNTGYIETRGVTNVTFQNICFSGTNKGIIFKSFRNRLLNCSFNGFNNAISVESGTNWNGENIIDKCTFNTVVSCIELNNGSDGDISGCLVDGRCAKFISGGYDSGYKIQNNHDYSTQGSVLTGYNTLIVGNYIDGFNKLEITGNGGFTIVGNMFYGTDPVSGTNSAIKFSNANSIITGTITGNTVSTNNNDTTNDYLYFIDIEDVSYFSYVNISGNNIRVTKALFNGASVTKIYNSIIDQSIQLNIFNVNNKATITSSYGIQSNGSAVCHTNLTLDGLTNAEVIRYENTFPHWIHYIKMNNESDVRVEFSNDNRVYARGSYSEATSMEVWSIGLGEKAAIPFSFIPE